jgi:phosphatidylserine/phosphatidylglycerophosphate/cardiolipin synthase-like enzyme
VKKIIATMLCSLLITPASYPLSPRASWKKAVDPLKAYSWICDKDIYKLKNRYKEIPSEDGKSVKKVWVDSPLFKKVKEAVNKVPNKNHTVHPDYLWSKGRISTQVFRGGDEIFNQMAHMIENAEHEVLLQTFIFNIKSPATYKIFNAISRLEAKRKKMKAKKPVVVRFIFDIIGTQKFFNFFELMVMLKDGGRDFKSNPFSFGREKGDYRVNFPRKLDPKYVRFEIKAHRHKALRAVNHAKSIIIDREYGLITGANMVTYHSPSEINTPAGAQLMVDHAFAFHGDIGLNMAAEFYNLWQKSKLKNSKKHGYTDYFGGNVDPDELFVWDSKRFKNVKPYPAIPGIKLQSWGNKTEIGIVGRDSYGITRRISQAKTPQNNAFKAVIDNAKSHININSPNLNSFDLMKALRDAMGRGVDINFLVSKNYQNYNGPLQEGGTNEQAVKKLMEWREELVKKNGVEKTGQFNLVWFVTRGGAISGKQKGERVESWRIILNEKFYNHNHTKFLTADNQVTIVGSANFDEQSWYNSRELNIAIDDHKTAAALCKKVFLPDFMRGQGFASKLWVGEKCWKNSQCRSTLCDNRIFKSWKCVHREGTGLSGAYCNNHKQCKSNICDKNKDQCL